MVEEIIAIALSPVVAVLITLWIQSRKEKRDRRYMILSTLIANRETYASPENVRALNMIELIFHDSEKIRRLWGELFAIFMDRSLGLNEGLEKQRRKYLELVVEMARTLGYGKVITPFNTDRRYLPQRMLDQMVKQNELLDELLRVLKASGGIQFVPKAGAN
jgi:hypothetical protein